jgi:hypothetical protein
LVFSIKGLAVIKKIKTIEERVDEEERLKKENRAFEGIANK